MEEAQPQKFSNELTPAVDTYIQECQKNNIPPTLQGFAQTINVTLDTIWAWATKNKKDDEGNLTQEMARPNFFAVIKKLEKIEKDAQPKEDLLNAKQELFCQLYATDREFFGNGVESYMEVYELDRHKPNWYKTACAAASRLLSDVKVFTRINELLEDGGLNDVNVDKQLQFLINQQDDKSTKLAAIREYNKLKARITDRIDHTTNGKDIPTPIYGGKSEE